MNVKHHIHGRISVSLITNYEHGITSTTTRRFNIHSNLLRGGEAVSVAAAPADKFWKLQFLCKSGDPTLVVPKGRKNGRVSKTTETSGLPAPTCNISQLQQNKECTCYYKQT